MSCQIPKLNGAESVTMANLEELHEVFLQEQSPASSPQKRVHYCRLLVSSFPQIIVRPLRTVAELEKYTRYNCRSWINAKGFRKISSCLAIFNPSGIDNSPIPILIALLWNLQSYFQICSTDLRPIKSNPALSQMQMFRIEQKNANRLWSQQ